MTTITDAVAREQEKPLVIEALELDEIRPNEARVKLVATGVCHTDAIVRDGVYPTPLPAVLGQSISSHFFGQSSFGSYADVVETSLVKVPDTTAVPVDSPSTS